MISRVLLFLALCLTVSVAMDMPYPASLSCIKLPCRNGFICVDSTAGPLCIPYNPCGCSRVYRPVCCKTLSGFESKSNACLCRCATGGKVYYAGEPCYPTGCVCKKIYAPVCCMVKEGIFTAGNRCECGCHKGQIVSGGCVIPSFRRSRQLN